jgi:SCY1-like protein 1
MFSSLTSFITSSISSLPFKLTSDEIVHPGQSVAQGGGVWKQFQGVRVVPGVSGALAAGAGPQEAVSVFTFDKKTSTTDQHTLAKNTLQKIKTLRHPNIVKYIDSVDNPTHLHIITELVTPLLFEPIRPSDHVRQLGASLGLHQLATTLSWLNNDAKLVHSNIHPGSLYTTDSGDWKLFGLDLCHKGTESIPDAILSGRNSGILPVQYRAPELTKNSSSTSPPSVIHATDSWSLGCLIYHTFNSNFSSPQQLAAAGNIPQALTAEYKKLLATNPANRLNPKQLLDGAFFQNEIVSTVTFLENLAIHSAAEKDAFFIRFAEHVGEFPPAFCKYKILPQLTKSLDYGSGLTCFSAILRSVLRIGSTLTQEEYAVQVLPCMVKLFASNERSIRVHLLQNLGEYAPSLSAELINDQLFAHVLTGFGDAHATLRELTVKSLMHFAGKLNPTNMDHALKWLAKLQTDPEPAIRTNTGYCLAKIAPHLTPATAEKVLIPAFTKMMRDPFPPARIAGVTALTVTLEQHRPQDIARKILPCVTPALADDVPDVRIATMKLVEASVRVIGTWSAAEKVRQEEALKNAPNAMGGGPVGAPGQPNGQHQQAPGGVGALNDAGQVAGAVLGSLGSWAVGAVRNKMSNADANPPAKNLQAGQQTQSNASSSLAKSNKANNNFYASSSTTTTSGSSSAPRKSSFDNDDFDDFGADPEGEDSDGPTPVVLAALSTKKTTKKETKPSSTKAKSSILAGGGKTASSSPPASSGSLSTWDFSMDDSSSTAANNSVLDDFDDWGSSVASTAATSAPSSSKHTSKPSTSSSSGFDLLSASSAPATQHKKSPSSAASNDPFASLSLSSAASPKAPVSSPGGMTMKAKATPIVAAPIKATSAATGAAAKKAAVDDWGDFLNS